MPDEKMGFTFNLLQSCWGCAAQIEAITDQRLASGWHISWRRATGSNQQNSKGVVNGSASPNIVAVYRFIRRPLEW